MNDFRQLPGPVYVSPQISAEDLAAAADLGVRLVINNRPEGEAEDQTPGAEIAAAAHAAGMDYLAIPITMQSLSKADVEAMKTALERAPGPILAYCRSGTRSTLLWALARSLCGDDPEASAVAAAAAGYDVSPVRSAMDAFAAEGK